MCGIFVSVRTTLIEEDSTEVYKTLATSLKDQNAKRGPDAQNAVVLRFRPENPESVPQNSTALSKELLMEMYGSELRLRGDYPVVQPHVKDGCVLCWNGEVFDGTEIRPEENDGLKMLQSLSFCDTTDAVIAAMSVIEGPYAMAFFHSKPKHLYFARDPLGRRSLLVHWPTQQLPYFLVSSVSAGASPGYSFEELPTKDIFCLDIAALQESLDFVQDFKESLLRLDRVPKAGARTAFNSPAKVNQGLPPEAWPIPKSLDDVPDYLESVIDDFITHLDNSVKLRVQNIPQQAPGQARLAVLFSGGIDCTIVAYLAEKYIPEAEPIDLLNVAFENPRKLKGDAAGMSQKHPQKGNTSGHSDEFKSYRVPDRVTSISEVEELRRLCPKRVWNFVEVNVPYVEFQAARPLVESLMCPGRTVMDLSLAMALYFASRGQGHVRDASQNVAIPYTSRARVLLSGLGSDELLGGYGRHRTSFETGSWQGVIEELQLEIDRIPTRNLGRDDRVISSHGKETRHPFLSLSFVSFLASLPIHFKLDPRVPTGFGDKMLLRYACRKLGLLEASSRKKRAMQFGSHSARMDGEKRGDIDVG